MKSVANRRFRELFHSLPPDIRDLAFKTYRLWQRDPYHPSLRFRRLKGGPDRFTVRVGDPNRALGRLTDDTVLWVWIGSHTDYDRLVGWRRRQLPSRLPHLTGRALLGRVEGKRWATYPANFCPLLCGGEFSKYSGDFGEAIDQSVKRTQGGIGLGKGSSEHLQDMLSGLDSMKSAGQIGLVTAVGTAVRAAAEDAGDGRERRETRAADRSE